MTNHARGNDEFHLLLQCCGFFFFSLYTASLRAVILILRRFNAELTERRCVGIKKRRCETQKVMTVAEIKCVWIYTRERLLRNYIHLDKLTGSACALEALKLELRRGYTLSYIK